jgi:hypothetical protein
LMGEVINRNTVQSGIRPLEFRDLGLHDMSTFRVVRHVEPRVESGLSGRCIYEMKGLDVTPTIPTYAYGGISVLAVLAEKGGTWLLYYESQVR